MRTFMAMVLGLAVSGAAFGQGFITKADQDARKKDLQTAAQKLLDTPDTHERIKMLADMIKKDVIADSAGKPMGDGFAVEAFGWLYKQGLKGEPDVDARLVAVVGLESLSSPAMRDILVEAASTDPSDAVQLRAIQAIEKRGIIRAGKDMVLKLRSANMEVATAAARCLAAINYDPQNSTAGAMIDLMADAQSKLGQAAADDPTRADAQRFIQVLGQSCSTLVPSLSWNPGQTPEDMARELAKFTGWWNAKFLPGLKDAKIDARREALGSILRTGDRAAFPAVLDATQKEITRLAGGDFNEKEAALQFVVDASRVLARVSSQPDTELRPSSTPDEMSAAVKKWQEWLAKQK